MCFSLCELWLWMNEFGVIELSTRFLAFPLWKRLVSGEKSNILNVGLGQSGFRVSSNQFFITTLKIGSWRTHKSQQSFFELKFILRIDCHSSQNRKSFSMIPMSLSSLNSTAAIWIISIIKGNIFLAAWRINFCAAYVSRQPDFSATRISLLTRPETQKWIVWPFSLRRGEKQGISFLFTSVAWQWDGNRIRNNRNSKGKASEFWINIWWSQLSV